MCGWVACWLVFVFGLYGCGGMCVFELLSLLWFGVVLYVVVVVWFGVRLIVGVFGIVLF